MNEHINDYLKYYISLPDSPGYAVLLRGDWGSGKSFFIRDFIQKNDPQQFIYITLFGVNSSKEINDQIFEQLHPFLASKGMKLAGKFLSGIVKTAIKMDLKTGN
jgi:hypothetical protein